MNDTLELARREHDVVTVIYRSRYQAEQDGLSEEETDDYIDRHVAAWAGAREAEDGGQRT